MPHNETEQHVHDLHTAINCALNLLQYAAEKQRHNGDGLQYFTHDHVRAHDILLAALRAAPPAPAPEKLGAPATGDAVPPHGSCLICGHDRPFSVWHSRVLVGACQTCRDAGHAAAGLLHPSVTSAPVEIARHPSAAGEELVAAARAIVDAVPVSQKDGRADYAAMVGLDLITNLRAALRAGAPGAARADGAQERAYRWPKGTREDGEPHYRCGAFDTATGAQCVKESDHDGDHIIAARGAQEPEGRDDAR